MESFHLGDLLSPHVAVLEIRNAKGSVQLNAIMRLARNHQGQPVAALEPIYDSYSDYHTKKEATLLTIRLALEQAEAMGIALGLPSATRRSTHLQLLAGTIALSGSEKDPPSILIQGGAPFGYFDETGIITKNRKLCLSYLSRLAAQFGAQDLTPADV